MITGDHPGTAVGDREGARHHEPMIEPSRAQSSSRLPDEVLDRTVREVSVYARVNPEHKLRIVKALQRNGATSWR